MIPLVELLKGRLDKSLLSKADWVKIYPGPIG